MMHCKQNDCFSMLLSYKVDGGMMMLVTTMK